MKKSFALLVAVFALSGCLALAGCGSGKTTASVSAAAASGAAAESADAESAESESASEAAEPDDSGLGATIEFDGLDISFGDTYSTTTLDNEFADHAGDTIIALPVSITNNDSDTHGLNMFAVTEFGSQGTELDNVFTYFDDDVRMMGDMRPGASMSGNLYFLYDGNGDYYLTFGFYSTDAEVKVPIEL